MSMCNWPAFGDVCLFLIYFHRDQLFKEEISFNLRRCFHGDGLIARLIETYVSQASDVQVAACGETNRREEPDDLNLIRNSRTFLKARKSQDIVLLRNFTLGT